MERILNKQAVINRVKSLQMNTLRGNWRKTILIVCVVALGIDPLYLFVPVVDSPKFCFTFDKKLATGVSVLRTFIDVFYVVHIILNFMRYSNGELNLHAKPKRETYYFISYTIVDILSVLPMPQVCVHFFSLSCILLNCDIYCIKSCRFWFSL